MTDLMSTKSNYRLITGKDDANFCKRISKLIEEGYQLYGSPSIIYNGKDIIAAQAVVFPNEQNPIKQEGLS